MQQRQRQLSDEDIQALADAMEQRLAERFYSNVGRGVWNLVWRAAVVVMVALASYGALKGFKY